MTAHGAEVTALSIDVAVFKACCELWLIFHSTLSDYHDEKGGDTAGKKTSTVSLTLAEDVYRQLLVWADNLPLDLVRGCDNSHSVMMMQ